MIRALCLAVSLTACAASADPIASGVSGTDPAPMAPLAPAPPPPATAPASSHAPTKPAPLPTAPPASASPIVAELERELALITETHYTHTTHVDESEGAFDVDCSGFVDYILTSALPTAYAAVAAAAPTTHGRPLAVDYVTFLSSPAATSGWEAVTTVAELVPGDLIAWIEPAGASDTGHVMVVRDAPTARDDASFIVAVWDSVSLPHGATDSRAPTNATGIGAGEIVLFVDDNGAPVAHEWSDGSAKVIQKTSLGRLQQAR